MQREFAQFRQGNAGSNLASLEAVRGYLLLTNLMFEPTVISLPRAFLIRCSLSLSLGLERAALP